MSGGQRPRRWFIPVGMNHIASALSLLLGSALLTACSSNKCGDADADCAPATTATEPGTTAATTTTGEPTTDTSGEPTTGAPSGLQRCQPTCEVDADCSFDGADIGFRCVAGVCDLPPCIDDLGCQQTYSGWTTPCMGATECFMGEVCIDIGGGDGRCAISPTPEFMCGDLGLDELMRPALEGGADVLVCGNQDATCVGAVCKNPCQSDAECNPQTGQPHCDTGTGECTCASDQECQDSMQPGLVACVAGRCGCTVDADCEGGTNVDACFDGACGCSSGAACTDPIYDNVVQICAAP